MRKSKRWMAVIMAAGLAASVFAGCGGTPEPQEDLVKPKEESTQAPQAAAEGSIAEQVQAPSRFALEFSDTAGQLSVSVDASVTVPAAEGFRLKTVASRTFTQEDYDAVNRVLLGGGALWERAVEEDDPAHGFTKAEIEQRIEELKRLEATGATYVDEYGDERSYGEAIKNFEEMLKYAPETVGTREIEAKVQYDPDAAANGTPEKNWLMGNVTADGKDYVVSLGNELTPDWRWISFMVSYLENGGNYMPVGDAPAAGTSLNAPPEDIISKAEQAAADMGFDEFMSCGGEYFSTFTEDEEGKMVAADNGYGVYFTRVIDGIPVTYTHTDGSTSEGNWSSWPYEKLYMIYNDGGLVDFQWWDPYTVADKSDEYVFLMPFDEIQKIFKEMFQKKYAFYTENNMKVNFAIDEIRLGYMRVMEKGNVMEGTMVPVWDFFGSQTVEREDGTTEVTGGPYDSWFTINAMDGTVIDRNLGY